MNTHQHLILVLLLSACGAPLKNADDVEGDVASANALKDKMGHLCKSLQKRSEAPNLQKIAYVNEMCSSPAHNFINFREYQNLDYVDFSLAKSTSQKTPQGAQNEDILKIETRTEIFLNMSVLQFVQNIFDSLDNTSSNIFDKGGKTTTDNNFHIEEVQKPVFDKNTLEFSLELRISSSRQENGMVDVDNNFRVRGKLIDNKYIAATAETVGVGDVNKTIIRESKILTIIVPHAGDMYMEIVTNTDYHSFGIDGVFEKKAKDTLKKAIKGIPDIVAKTAK